MKHDFAVIGAGVSGIASALILARHGFRVVLLEKAARTAPLLRGFTRDGVRFDTGFHYTGGLGRGGALDIAFRCLGLSDRIDPFPFDEDGFDVFRDGESGFEFRFPVGYGPLRERLIDAFPGERAAVEGYLDAVRADFDSAPYLNPDARFDVGGAVRKIFGPTLKETLDSLTGNDVLKCVLSTHCLLYGVSPAEVSFYQHACIAGGYYLSAHGIRGGGERLAGAFDARLEELGVDVRCGSGVSGILTGDGGAVRGIRLDTGDEIPCGGIVASIHPRALPRLLPEGAFRPADIRRIEALEDTLPASLLFQASEASVPFLSGRNLFVFPRIGRLETLGTEEPGRNPLYLTAACDAVTDTPRGFIGITPAPGGAAEAGTFAKMEEIVKMYCPELGGALGPAEGSTPSMLRHFRAMPPGGMYGVKHRVGQRNPGPTTRVKNLFLAGQAVTGPGILGAVLSGFTACGCVLGHDRLGDEFRRCR